MTQQNKNPENDPKRIKINVEDLGTEGAEQIDVAKESAGKIILGAGDFEESPKDEGKLGDGEREAAVIFKAFVEEHLPEKSDDAEDKKLEWRNAAYKLKSDDQLVPVSVVEFTEHKEESSSYLGIELKDKGGMSLKDVRYDQAEGFVDVSERNGTVEMNPQEAVDMVAILTAASERGDLKPTHAPSMATA